MCPHLSANYVSSCPPNMAQVSVWAGNLQQSEIMTAQESINTQFMPEGWHERLGGSALADSILDRIIPSAYTMRIDGDVSMRQRKRMIKN